MQALLTTSEQCVVGTRAAGREGEGCVPMPGQGRVAMASGNVPDFDGLVAAAAGDKLTVGRKSDGNDTEIETSHHMKHTGREHETHRQRGKTWKKQRTRTSGRSPGTHKSSF